MLVGFRFCRSGFIGTSASRGRRGDYKAISSSGCGFSLIHNFDEREALETVWMRRILGSQFSDFLSEAFYTSAEPSLVSHFAFSWKPLRYPSLDEALSRFRWASSSRLRALGHAPSRSFSLSFSGVSTMSKSRAKQIA